MAYAEIKKAPLDLTGRVLGRIGDPGSAQPQALHPASRYSGEDASAGLTVSRFDPPRLARAHGATPPCGPGLSRNRRQLAVGPCVLSAIGRVLVARIAYKLVREERDVVNFFEEGTRFAAGADLPHPGSWLGGRPRLGSCPYRIGKMPKRPFNRSGRFA